MNDWREMEAGADLNRNIALRLGWVEVLALRDSDGAWWDVYNPDGNIVATAMSDTGLANFWLCNYTPAYSTDLNVAWALLDTLPNDHTPRIVRILEPRGDHMAHVVKAGIIHAGYEQVEAYADTPALAICRAWLAWKEAQEQAA